MPRLTRRLVGAALGLALPMLAPPAPVGAQSAPPAPSRPVRAGQEWALTLLDTLPGGEFLYQYRLRVDSTLHPRGVAQVRLDITSPRTRFPPGLTGVRGTFLFDALRRQYEEATVSHPPLFVGTPRQWVSFIDRDGFLTWRSDRPSRSPIQVGHYLGREPDLVGFLLQSRAVPALRPWFTEELIFDLRDPEQRGGRPAPRPSQTAGYQIGPGWLPEQVTPAWTAEQIRLLCGVGLIPDCTAWAPIRQGLRATAPAAVRQAAQAGRALVLSPAGQQLAPLVRLILIKHLSLVLAPVPPAPGT